MRRFCEREIAPFHAAWEEQGVVPRAIWRRAGELGFLCMTLPAEYGGADADFRASVVFTEELARIGASGPGFALQSDIVAPYFCTTAARSRSGAGCRAWRRARSSARSR